MSRVKVGKTLLHIVIQRPRLPHQVASPSPRAREPCTGLSVGKEGGGHGAVAWTYYRPDLNMADFISGHTVHWPELVTRHTWVQSKLGNVVLLCSGGKWNRIWWIPSIVSATHRFSRSLLFTTMTSKGYMVPLRAFVQIRINHKHGSTATPCHIVRLISQL